MQSPTSPHLDSSSMNYAMNMRKAEAASIMVDKLARIAAGSSVRLLTAADQAASAAATLAIEERVIFSTIGLGIVPNFCRGSSGTFADSSSVLQQQQQQQREASSLKNMDLETIDGDDATEAACKALLDAFERGSFWSLVSHSNLTAGGPTQLQLLVRVGVPSKLRRPQELMHVDQNRILSHLIALQKQHHQEGRVFIELLNVDVTVGGLWAQHHGKQELVRGTLAVVASVSVLQQQRLQPQHAQTLAPPSIHQHHLTMTSARSPQLLPVSPHARITPKGDTNFPEQYPKSSQQDEPRASPELQFPSRNLSSPPTAVWASPSFHQPMQVDDDRHQRLLSDTPYQQNENLNRSGRQQLSAQSSSLQQQVPPTTSKNLEVAACTQDLIHRSSSMDVLAHVSAEIRDKQHLQEEEEQQQLHRRRIVEHVQKLEAKQIQVQQQSLKGGVSPATDAVDFDSHLVPTATSLAQPDSTLSAYGDKYGNNTNYKKLPPGKTPKNNKRLFVKHSYQDYSQEVPSTAEIQQGEMPKTANAAFPLKLHETLSEIERDGHDDIVGWLPHGRSFKIHKQQEFVQRILPKYFVMTKKSSFLRQLNLYGFNRLSGVGPDQASYYHEKFLRGMKFLCRRMQRIKVNGNRIRAAGNPDEEPDLSGFPVCPPPSSSSIQHHELATAAVLQFMAKQQHEQQQQHQASNHGALQSLLALLPAASSSTFTSSVVVGGRGASGREQTEVATKDRRSPSLSSSDSTGTNNNFSGHNNNNQGDVSATTSASLVSFPLKLQRILDKLESEGNCSVVSWLPHGRAFMVHNPDRFVHELMPLYFNQTKYSSFQRQLHMYNFQRITTGRDKGAYHHAQFQRGQPVLCQTMQRTRVNGKGTRQPGNPQAEPDFYQMPPVAKIPFGSLVEIPTQVVFPSNNNGTYMSLQQEQQHPLQQPPFAAAPSVSSSSAAAESDDEGY